VCCMESLITQLYFVFEKKEVDIMMTIMKQFGNAACLRISIAKSTMVTIKSSAVNLDEGKGLTF
jgi:hypothetical protein